MTSVTSTIPNFLGGISSQSDQQKLPNQLADAVNVYPDVTTGLQKRAGTKFISELTATDNGSWFNWHKNNPFTDDEKYIGQVTRDGKVRIWNIDNGVEQDVCYASNPLSTLSKDGLRDSVPGVCPGAPDYDQAYEDYLVHEDNNQLHFLTVSDYTFITNRKEPVTMSQSAISNRPYEAFIDVKNLVYLQNYTINIREPDDTSTQTFTYANEVQLEWLPPAPILDCGSDRGSCFKSGSTTYNNLNFGSGTGMSLFISVPCTPVPNPSGNAYEPYCSRYSYSNTLLFGGEGYQLGDETEIDFPGSDIRFKVKVVDVRYRTASAGIGTSTYSFTDNNISLDANSILSKFETDLRDLGFTTQVIGNGLYVTRDEPFIIEAGDPALLGVMSSSNVDGDKLTNGDPILYSQLNNVSLLPGTCKDGFLVKIVNSTALEDDYYLEFHGNGGMDGPGVWEETTKPGIFNNFEVNSLPHTILRTSSIRYDILGNLIAKFYVGPLAYNSREAGDEITNPRPSFAPQVGFNFGRPINGTIFFRDRLCFLSDENIIMSRTGDYFNFFAATALALRDDDPIDIAATGSTPSVIYDALGINNGLLLFGKNAQYLLTTDGDVLTPATVKVTPISNYYYDENLYPIHMGTTVGFANNVSNRTKFYEMYNIFREGEPDVVEQSKVIDTVFPGGIDLLADSKAEEVIAFSKRGESYVWIFKYFQEGEKRRISSWYRWDIPGKIQTINFTQKSFYVVTELDGKYNLLKMDIEPISTAQFIDEIYRIHLDYYGSVHPVEMLYDFSKNVTRFYSPIPIVPNQDYMIVGLGEKLGELRKATVKDNFIAVEGDWTDHTIAVGYNFTMNVELPHLYVKKDAGNGAFRSDSRASLTIHRLRINFDDIGVYTANVVRKGRETYTQLFESNEPDNYLADTPNIQNEETMVLPIYERNTNASINISSTHPAPCVLLSGEWEGDYNARYYRRV